MNIVIWLEADENEAVDITAKVVKNGIELTCSRGSSLKKVFVDLLDLGDHGGAHLDLQLLGSNGKWQSVEDRIMLGIASLGGQWDG